MKAFRPGNVTNLLRRIEDDGFDLRPACGGREFVILNGDQQGNVFPKIGEKPSRIFGTNLAVSEQNKSHFDASDPARMPYDRYNSIPFIGRDVVVARQIDCPPRDIPRMTIARDTFEHRKSRQRMKEHPGVDIFSGKGGTQLLTRHPGRLVEYHGWHPGTVDDIAAFRVHSNAAHSLQPIAIIVKDLGVCDGSVHRSSPTEHNRALPECWKFCT